MENKFYIPFETAKLLKDKGFPQENEWFMSIMVKV